MYSKDLTVNLMLMLAIWFCILTPARLEEDIEMESSLIRCSDKEDDSQVIDWKASPLHFLDEDLKIGPHSQNSALSPELHNDFKLKLSKTCKRKIVITLKIKDTPRTSVTKDALVIVDRVKNDITQRNSRLGLPVIVKVHQSPILQLYEYKYIFTVNAKVTERVINNENTKNYSGCHDSEAPTCGVQLDSSGNAISESRGFCCRCDPGNSSHQKRGKQKCPGSLKKKDKTDLNYYASAHCLQQSKHWYAVHEILPPKIEHRVLVQVYTGKEMEDAQITWNTLTDSDKMEEVGLGTPDYLGKNLSISYHRLLSTVSPGDEYLNGTTHYLLVPLPQSNYFHDASEKGGKSKEKSEIPEPLKGNVGDNYLVVKKELVDATGATCNTIGVSHSAFAHQKNPCQQSAGTCLENQPFDLWNKGKDENSKTTKVKLKHFGPIYENSPVKIVEGKRYIVIQHDKKGTPSYINLEFGADDLDILSPGYNGGIESVTVHSAPSGVTFRTEIVNKELVAATFSVEVIKCTEQLPGGKTKPKKIEPRRTKMFSLSVPFEKDFRANATCFVILVNTFKEIIAARQVLLSSGDICICLHSCECTCTKNSLHCVPINSDEIIAAGLIEESSSSNNNNYNPSGIGKRTRSLEPIFFLVLIFILLLLILGLIKGILGLYCSPGVGAFGLSFFNDHPRKISKYYEKHLQKEKVVYDDENYPVNPFTRQRTVKTVGSREQLYLNIPFFVEAPILFVYWLCRKCKCQKDRKSKGKVVSVKPMEEQRVLLSDSCESEEDIIWSRPSSQTNLQSNRSRIVNNILNSANQSLQNVPSHRKMKNNSSFQTIFNGSNRNLRQTEDQEDNNVENIDITAILSPDYSKQSVVPQSSIPASRNYSQQLFPHSPNYSRQSIPTPQNYMIPSIPHSPNYSKISVPRSQAPNRNQIDVASKSGSSIDSISPIASVSNFNSRQPSPLQVGSRQSEIGEDEGGGVNWSAKFARSRYGSWHRDMDVAEDQGPNYIPSDSRRNSNNLNVSQSQRMLDEFLQTSSTGKMERQ